MATHTSSVIASAGIVRSAPISPVVLIRGAGEMASAVAWRLRMANIQRICMTELDTPLCVRRTVSFCTALEGELARVEGVEARAANDVAEVAEPGATGKSPWSAQPWDKIASLVTDVIVDAILAKRNIATSIADAPLVVALGPGFIAGRDCHLVADRIGAIISAVFSRKAVPNRTQVFPATLPGIPKLVCCALPPMVCSRASGELAIA